MNNVAIIIGESKYDNNDIENLEMCKKDASRIHEVIKKSHKYNKIFFVTDGKKEEIYDIFLNLKKIEKIDELFFYYSGHGYQRNGSFYYITKETEINRINSTSINNMDIDAIVRECSPSLFVKIVDACNSGNQYIKNIFLDDITIKNIEESKIGFNNCFFMFSSLSNQVSFAKEISSIFTMFFLKAINNTFKNKDDIKYRDIANEITDSFENDKRQKPYFVTQGFNNEIFIKKNKDLEKAVAMICEEFLNINSLKMDKNSKKRICSKDDAMKCRDIIFKKIFEILLNQNETFIENNYTVYEKNILAGDIIFKDDIGKWIDENKANSYIFADAIKTPVWNSWGLHINEPPDRLDITGFKLNVEVEKSIREIEFKCNDYPLPKYNFQIVAIFSINYLYLIYNINKAMPKNWDEYEKYEKLSVMCIKKINMRNTKEFENISDEIIENVNNNIAKDLKDSLKAYES